MTAATGRREPGRRNFRKVPYGIVTEGVRDWVEAAYTVETDIEKLVDKMIDRIEEKRTALGI